MAKSLLIVDDDQSLLDALASAFKRRGFDVYCRNSVEVALELLPEILQLDYAVIDLMLSGSSGLTLLSPLKERFPHSKVIMLTGYGTVSTAVAALKLGASEFLTKPTDANAILRAFSGDLEVEKVPETSLADFEREHINRALVECDGNVTQAAKRLGLHRRTLQRKLLKQ